MIASIERVGETFRIGSRTAAATVVIALVGLVALVAIVTKMGMLSLALALVAGAAIALLSLRWPMIALTVFIVMIPIEQVVVIDGFGTISKLAGVLFAVSYGATRLGNLSLAVIPPAAWAFLGWALLSLGWAIDPRAAWTELSTLLQLFVIAFLIADVVVQRPNMVRPILWIYSLSALATALFGIQAYVALGPAAVDARAAALQDQNPAQYAAALMPALIFGLYEMLNGPHRLAGAAIALLTTVGIVVSGTRGAWLSVAIVVVVFILPRLQLRRQLMAIGAVVLIGLVTLQIPGVASLVVDRAVTAVSTGGAGRTDIWTVGVSIYESSPILGVGYANFPIAYTGNAVRTSEVSTGHGVGRGPHNLIIGTISELGPIGLLLLAMFLLPLALRPGWGPDAATVQASLASLLLLALFLDIVGNRKQVWLVIGLAAGLAYLRRKASQPAPETALDAELPRVDARIAPRGVIAGASAVATELEPGA